MTAKCHCGGSFETWPDGQVRCFECDEVKPMTSDAQRKAQAKYDAKRPSPVPVRMNAAQLARLDALRQPGEGRGPALLRLAGLTMPPGE